MAGLFVALLVGTAFFVSSESYVLWRVPKYVDNDYALLAAISGVAFLIGLALIQIRRMPTRQLEIYVGSNIIRVAQKSARVTFWIAILGYIFWVVAALRQGAGIQQVQAVLNFQEGSVGDLKRVSVPVGGLTTLTQLAAISVTLRFFLIRVGIRDRVWELYVLLALSVMRAFFYGERLALIEVAVPIVILLVVVSQAQRKAAGGTFVRAVLPVLAVPALWSVFAIFEYSRSWLAYRLTTDKTFFEYITDRLLGYYITSINNSSLYHQKLVGLTHDPLFSFPAVWDSPVVGQLLGPAVVSGTGVRSWWSATLASRGNPEFNNAGTFLVVDADIGTFGSVVYWMVLGILIGLAYYKMRTGRLAGLLAYATVFLGLLELLRIIYWVQGRFVPTLIGIVIVGAMLSNAQDEDEANTSGYLMQANLGERTHV
ncbi:oligosaccharide repeat unit polymerase [Rhodococcus pyridinivorans]|uniref:Oligosaccharide repeat unit polymerase n=1 Tax=Rhodococcus pyridinivorans TaxID=103816 RepID=A0A7M2XJW9_9NOCA|nr:oligosaccharide repeat unit polymerase [Rhodococcus pyridinivorans]